MMEKDEVGIFYLQGKREEGEAHAWGLPGGS